jgi:isoaspartyl peptidase/L-asparaginase-like protein (Ntn-hydrolase superfamily)
MLAGNGAKQFALENGFESIDLLTDKQSQLSRIAKTFTYKPL